MTERSARAMTRSETALAIGKSALTWDGKTLTIDIDERSCPIPSRVKGQVRLTPKALNPMSFALDAASLHHWHPMAPVSDVEVSLEAPGKSWQGAGYFDMNWGSEPLGDAFRYWTWSHSSEENRTRILYDARRRDGTDHIIAIDVDSAGNATPFSAPPRVTLPKTLWRVDRDTRSDNAGETKVIKTLEDTPFYSRSLIRTILEGKPITAVHESLSLDRFRHPIVQMMLPFRMPRRG